MSNQHQELQLRAIAWMAAQCNFDDNCKASPELVLDKGYVLDAGGLIVLPQRFARKLNMPDDCFAITIEERQKMYEECLADFHGKHFYTNLPAEERERYAHLDAARAQCWGAKKISIAIEVKCSKSDFQNHFGKSYEVSGRNVLYGNLNYVFAPKHILTAAELPLDWGLIEVLKRGCRIIKPAKYQETPAMSALEWADLLLWKNDRGGWTFWNRFCVEQPKFAKNIKYEMSLEEH